MSGVGSQVGLDVDDHLIAVAHVVEGDHPQVAAIATPQVSAIATPREKFKGWRVGKVGAVPEFVDETEE